MFSGGVVLYVLCFCCLLPAACLGSALWEGLGLEQEDRSAASTLAVGHLRSAFASVFARLLLPVDFYFPTVKCCRNRDPSCSGVRYKEPSPPVGVFAVPLLSPRRDVELQ